MLILLLCKAPVTDELISSISKKLIFCASSQKMSKSLHFADFVCIVKN